MHSIIKDLRYGFGQLLKNPGFALMAVLSLALGIGANAAIFSLLDALMLKSLPVQKPHQLFFVQNGKPGFKPSSNVTYRGYEQLRQRGSGIVDASFFTYVTRVNANVGGNSEVVEGQIVSGSFFKTLGVRPAVGRMLDESDDIRQSNDVIVISHRYWQRRFGSAPSIVGQSITVNNRPFTIAGVAPAEFFGVIVGNAPDIFLPSTKGEEVLPRMAGFHEFPLPLVLARLADGATKEQAEVGLTSLFQQVALDEPGSQSKQRQRTTGPVQLRDAGQGFNTLREHFSKPLELLMVAVGLVLLIACANVANLLLARASSRRREIALRVALGASRFRIIRQLLTEGLLLSLIGGGLGLLLAAWGSKLLLAVVGSGRNPITAGSALSINAPIDARILLFTLGVSLLAAVLFGLAPAWRATRLDLSTTLKDTRHVAGVGRFSFGNLLVVAQLAISLTLLIGAGLFVRSLVKLRSVDTGFNRENVLLFSLDPQLVQYDEQKIAGLYKEALERLAVLPGVSSVSLGRQGLLSGGGTQGTIRVPGFEPPPESLNDEKNIPHLAQVGPRFFETLGMTIVAGRDFNNQDNETGRKVTVVNQAFARYYFGKENPIGRQIDRGEEDGGLFEIVGVVKDAKAEDIREQPARTYYLPFLQDRNSWRETTFQVRTTSDPLTVTGAIRSELHSLDPNLPVFKVRTLDQQVEESLGQERLVTTLASLFGGLALLLASVGLYGVLSYAVSRRTHEIGIRLALGARQINVLRLVVGNGMTLAVMGVAIGVAGAFALTRVLRSFLFEISPVDPITFVGMSVSLLLIALFACYLPARRATKVDPLVALRSE